MPVAEHALRESLDRINARRRAGELVTLESYAPQAFVLSFPDRAMPEGQCIDQDFSEIQFLLHDSVGIDTGIQGGRQDPETGRYHMTYEVIEWD
jgi:hypothetical protein